MIIKLISNRINFILKKTKDKEVLDVGCVDHISSTEKIDFWLHKNIKKVAKDLTGLDIEEKEVKKLNKKGYNIIVGNAENFNINKKFEVITSCELIEHLSNPSAFLESLKIHLKKNGEIILTTPNTFAIKYFFRNILFGKNIPNSQHVSYYDIYTLKQLFDRHNLKIIESYYFFDDKSSKIKYYIERFFCFFRKVFAPWILVVIKIK